MTATTRNRAIAQRMGRESPLRHDLTSAKVLVSACFGRPSIGLDRALVIGLSSRPCPWAIRIANGSCWHRPAVASGPTYGHGAPLGGYLGMSPSRCELPRGRFINDQRVEPGALITSLVTADRVLGSTVRAGARCESLSPEQWSPIVSLDDAIAWEGVPTTSYDAATAWHETT